MVVCLQPHLVLFMEIVLYHHHIEDAINVVVCTQYVCE